MKLLLLSFVFICASEVKAQSTDKKITFELIEDFDLVAKIQQTRVTRENGDVVCGYFNPADSFFYSCNKVRQFRVNEKHYFTSGAGCCASAQAGFATFRYDNKTLKNLPITMMDGTLAEIKTDAKTNKTTIKVSDQNAVFEIKLSAKEFKRAKEETPEIAVGNNYVFKIKERE